jgi:hypothetical protein
LLIVTGAGGGAVLGLVRLVGVGEGGRRDGVGTPTLVVADGVVAGGEVVAGDVVTSAEGLGAFDTRARPHAAPVRTQAVKTASQTRLLLP